MQRVLEDRAKGSLPHRQQNVVMTTLYEMIEAIHEEVQPEEKQIIPEIVINLLNTCRSNCWIK